MTSAPPPIRAIGESPSGAAKPGVAPTGITHSDIAPSSVARLSVAPMMQYTDRHFRALMRAVTRHTFLYTEMVTTGAILHGDRERLLAFDPRERPVSLQIGGDDPVALAECAHLAQELGYDQVNLNVGCPSDRVQRGNFGACLMLDPGLVAEGYARMAARVNIPVTIKHRIGVDERDSYEDLLTFVDAVAAAGCRHFIVHARKAWLQGLSPRENREIPPLRPAEVHRLARERPQLSIAINGGIRDLDTAAEHLQHVGGVMIGRAAWDTPFLFADADRRFFAEPAPAPSRRDVVERYLPHLERALLAGSSPVSVVRNILNLHAGRPGTRRWKRNLTLACAQGLEAKGLCARILGELDAIEALQTEMEGPDQG